LSNEPSQQPSDTPTEIPSQTPSSIPTRTPGQWKIIPDFVPGSTTPLLGHCQGDCDFDTDCAEGLVCFQRNKSESIPGCINGEFENSLTDYCIYKE
jgi:hypothetical protein